MRTIGIALRCAAVAAIPLAISSICSSRAASTRARSASARQAPALHVYVNLAGREPGGTVDAATYLGLVDQIARVLGGARDRNPFFNPGSARLFSHVWKRPMDCGSPGFCTDGNIGQDFGDVLALMVEGYNFDGTQNPVVPRLGDGDASVTAVYSVPNFYGAHGHDSERDSMSAMFMAAGPDLKQRRR